MLASATSGCFLKQSGAAAVPEVDPYAPAAPPSTDTESQPASSSNPGQGEDGLNTGSDQPVPVDAMMAQEAGKAAQRKAEPATEPVDPVTRDYSQAFDPEPAYSRENHLLRRRTNSPRREPPAARAAG